MMTWNKMFFQTPSSYLSELVILMHDYVMMFLLSTLLVVMVKIFLVVKMKNFNLEFYEGHQLESIWTLIPFILLIFIVLPSLTSLYMLDTCLFCGMSMSIVGHQWYWSYFYKELKMMMFDSYMTPSSSSNIRLLDVDNRLIIPTFMPIRFIVTSADVIHSWAMPAFGIKMDAVPGRMNQFCFSSKRSGVFFGQCSEICGANHSFMPIVLESLPLGKFLEILN